MNRTARTILVYMAIVFLVVVAVLTYRLVANLGALAINKDPAASGELSLNPGGDEP